MAFLCGVQIYLKIIFSVLNIYRCIYMFLLLNWGKVLWTVQRWVSFWEISLYSRQNGVPNGVPQGAKLCESTFRGYNMTQLYTQSTVKILPIYITLKLALAIVICKSCKECTNTVKFHRTLIEGSYSCCRVVARVWRNLWTSLNGKDIVKI